MQDEQTCVKQLKQRLSNNHKMRANESLKWFVKLQISYKFLMLTIHTVIITLMMTA